ncbi:MAG: DUF4118 domain-containing protein [Pseudomonadales bacterium]|nr:DUF4118 domain-containing protein [Pseudomonadales bacterium]MCP5182339.1 DUF4118 domain-containing protein [Pseudomonadales bacterium]
MGISRQALLTFTLPWLAPLLATGLALVLAPWLPVSNLTLVYLAAVLLTAANTRTAPAMVCALLSFLAYNFFFTQPRYSLAMMHREEILTITLFALVALVAGHRTARMHEQVTALKASESWRDQQISCSRDLSACASGSEIVAILRDRLEATLGWYVRDVTHTSGLQSGLLSPREMHWIEDPAGINVVFTDSTGKPAAILRLTAREPVSDWHRERVEVLTNLARLSWARVQLADSLSVETLNKEREQLRATLLSSVSHDLRTPLATMIGAVSSLIDLKEALTPAQSAELLDSTLSEALRLDRYIQKLLNMTRLGYGEPHLDLAWIGADDLVSAVLRRARPLLQTVHVDLRLPVSLPLLHVDAALMEQALFHVVENAARFSPTEGTIHIEADTVNDTLVVQITDEGPGIPTEDRERIFDMFQTFAQGDRYMKGTGLGLTICRAILQAHGGTIAAVEPPSGRGACLRMSLPLSREPDTDTGEEE